MLRQRLYFQLHRLIGSRVESYYREFFQLERMSPLDLHETQAKRLHALLRKAVTSVPYYKERVPAGTELSLEQFPILTKSEIRAHFDDLMTDQLRTEYHATRKRRQLYSWVEVKTGGSTGVPTSVIHDKELRDRGRAGRLYAQHLCGFPLGVPFLRLWGNMREVNRTNASFYHRMASSLSNEVLLNAYKMSEEAMDAHIRTINASPSEHMMVYADAAYHLARHILRTGQRVKPIRTIMSCASTLTPDMRETMEKAFQAKVFNKYGSRDATDIACECERGSFHIFSNDIVLEVVDAAGQRVPVGESGRILLTSLHNEMFPLIRYEIGDVGALSDKQCPCGRPFPLLERLEGRNVEVLLSNKGEYVMPSLVNGLIGITHNPGFIKRYQMVQTSLVDYELALETEVGVSEAALAEVLGKIERDLKVVFGNDSRIATKRVDEIPVTASGKFLYTVNKVKQVEHV